MRFLVSILLLLLPASGLCAAEPRAGASGSHFRLAKKNSPPRYRYKKPGKYKSPKLSGKKWKPTKEQRATSATDPFGRKKKN